MPLTGLKVVNLIVTEMAVIEVTPRGLVLKEIASDTTVEKVRAPPPAPSSSSTAHRWSSSRTLPPAGTRVRRPRSARLR